jgi:hypothetical protein
MARKQDNYYAPEVERHLDKRSFGRQALPIATTAVLGLVACGIGWLLYDRFATQAERARNEEARRQNQANARRALAMKKQGAGRTRRPDNSRHDKSGMRNIPAK